MRISVDDWCMNLVLEVPLSYIPERRGMNTSSTMMDRLNAAHHRINMKQDKLLKDE